MGPAVIIVEHEFSDGLKILAMQLSSGTLECTSIKMPKLFYCLSVSVRAIAFFRKASVYSLLHIPAVQSSMLMFLLLLNSCISVTEQFLMGLSQDSFLLEKNYLFKSYFVLRHAT